VTVDVEKTIEFLLDQQAKFWAAMEAARQELREHREGFAELRKGFAELQDIIRGVLAVQGTLVQSQIKHEEGFERLTAAQTRADERMDALIAVVNGLVGRERQEPPAG